MWRAPDFPFTVRIQPINFFQTFIFQVDEMCPGSAHSSPLTTEGTQIRWLVDRRYTALLKGDLPKCPQRHDLHRLADIPIHYSKELPTVCQTGELLQCLQFVCVFFFFLRWRIYKKQNFFRNKWEDKYTFKIVTNEEMSLTCHANCELTHSRILKKKVTSLPNNENSLKSTLKYQIQV